MEPGGARGPRRAEWQALVDPDSELPLPPPRTVCRRLRVGWWPPRSSAAAFWSEAVFVGERLNVKHARRAAAGLWLLGLQAWPRSIAPSPPAVAVVLCFCLGWAACGATMCGGMRDPRGPVVHLAGLALLMVLIGALSTVGKEILALAAALAAGGLLLAVVASRRARRAVRGAIVVWWGRFGFLAPAWRPLLAAGIAAAVAGAGRGDRRDRVDRDRAPGDGAGVGDDRRRVDAA